MKSFPAMLLGGIIATVFGGSGISVQDVSCPAGQSVTSITSAVPACSSTTGTVTFSGNVVSATSGALTLRGDVAAAAGPAVVLDNITAQNTGLDYVQFKTGGTLHHGLQQNLFYNDVGFMRYSSTATLNSLLLTACTANASSGGACTGAITYAVNQSLNSFHPINTGGSFDTNGASQTIGFCSAQSSTTCNIGQGTGTITLNTGSFTAAPARATCTLNGGTPSTCTAVVTSGVTCACNDAGGVNAIKVGVSGTTMTCSSIAGDTDVCNCLCL